MNLELFSKTFRDTKLVGIKICIDTKLQLLDICNYIYCDMKLQSLGLKTCR